MVPLPEPAAKSDEDGRFGASAGAALGSPWYASVSRVPLDVRVMHEVIGSVSSPGIRPAFSTARPASPAIDTWLRLLDHGSALELATPTGRVVVQV